MNWFSGDISQAVNLAKTKNAIFVVYCTGKDENSKILSSYINSQEVSSRLSSDSFVAVKIESDQPEYIQFCKIYQLVPVPSLFFIRNGIPIKVITSAVKSTAEIVETLDGLSKNSNATASASFIREEAKSAEENLAEKVVAQDKKTVEPEVVCEGGVCYKKEPEKVPEGTSEPSGSEISDKSEAETEEERQEKIKRAMQLIEEKRIERVKEEQRLEQEREIRRRKEGQELQKLKNWQDDQELQQLKDERKKEKLEAMEARRRVLEQIEEDKKERARRFNMSQTPSQEPDLVCQKPPKKDVQATAPSDSAKIQFKKPDGEAEIVTFDATMVFGDLHSFVETDLLQGFNIKEFTLATTFPRHEFTADDFGKTLVELNLAPSSVLLIIPGKKSPMGFASNKTSSVLPTTTDGSFISMISALFVGLVSPIFALFTYIKGIVFRTSGDSSENPDAGKRKRDEESLMANDAAKRRNMRAYNQPTEPSTSDASQTGAIPKPTTYKRANPSSNIHRLHQDSDSEDERKTYNGNSTQQM